MNISRTQQKIFTFLGLVLVFSSIFYYFIISAKSLEAAGGLYVLGLMWSPGLAGLITQRIFQGSFRGLGWRFGKAKYLLAAYCLPLVYCLIVYGVTWLTGLGVFPDSTFAQEILQNYTPGAASPTLAIVLYVLLMASLGLPSGVLSGLGEEIGWRGFLVPELYKITSYRNAMLISGAIWTLWHMPLIFFADYNLPGVPRWYAAIMFTLMVMGINFAFGWLRIKSGSIWPAVILHASHNLFIQTIFTPLTGQNQITPYIIDEFGIGMAVIGIAIALVCIKLQNKLPAPVPDGTAAQ